MDFKLKRRFKVRPNRPCAMHPCCNYPRIRKNHFGILEDTAQGS